MKRYRLFAWVWAAIIVLSAADSIDSRYRGGRTHWELTAVAIGLAVGFAVRFRFKGWNAAFYENGVLLPEAAQASVPRFFSWAQIERYYWEGDVLIIVPGASFLAGGGGSVGLPVTGGSVSIPRGRRSEVERLLSAIPAT